MAATNVQAFPGDVTISSNVTAANSKFSLDTNGTLKQNGYGGNSRYIKLMKYIGDASNWKIATGSYTGASYQWISIRAKITRLDQDVEIIQFNYLGHNGTSHVRDPIIIGGGTTSTQANEIKVYNKTGDSTYEIYLQIDDATSVEVEISHRNSTIDDDYSTVAAGAIDETGLTKIYDSSTTVDFIVKSGNVGIGLTNPGAKLHVLENTLGTTAGNSTDIVKFGGDSGGPGALLLTSERVSNGSTWTTTGLRLQKIVDTTKMGYIQFGDDSSLAGQLIFGKSDATETMRIDADGKVGIGTHAPVEFVHLYKNTTNGATMKFTSSGGYSTSIGQKSSSSSDRSMQFTSDGYAGTNLAFRFLTAGASSGYTEALTITGDAYVGIGTNNSAAPLHVYPAGQSPGTEYPLLNFSPSFSEGFLGISATATHTNAVGADLRFKGLIYAGASPAVVRDVMCLKPTGKVGIGTNTPSAILHVVSNTEIPLFEGDAGRAVNLRDSYALNMQGGATNISWDSYPGVVRTTGTTGEFRFHSSSGVISVRVDGSYLPFTGSHDTYHYYDESDEGKIVYATSDYESDLKTGVYHNEINIMQACPTVSLCNTEKDKRVIGVLATRTLQTEIKEITEEEYQELDNESKHSYSRNYSSNTYTTNIETNEYSKGMYNALGEGGIWVSNKNGKFENGDYITSSVISGYGQKQDDDILRNYTVAKITSDCDFNEVLVVKRKRLQIGNNFRYDENKQPLYENILDEDGIIITQPKFKLRYILLDGTEITKEQYNMAEEAYIAAFVGCTYHCG